MSLSPSPVPRLGSLSRNHRRFAHALTIAVAAGLMTAAVCTVEPLLSANDRSRWCTVWSLVDGDGTYRIDEIIQRPGWDTIDKVRHEGHFYSSKPALLPTLVAGVYWTVKQVTGWTLLEETAWAARAVLIVVNVIPLVIAFSFVAALAERYARTDWAKLYLVFAAALGTFLTTFAVTLNNHTVAAASVVFAVYPAMRILLDGKHCPGLFALAGFFAAFACTNELPAAPFGVALFGMLFVRAPKPTLWYFVPAALIPIGAFFGTNWLATGGWKPFYLYYGTEKYLYVHEGVPSYWMNPGGLDRNLDSPLVYFLHCTIGHHGIFSLSPLFLIALAGWIGLGVPNGKRAAPRTSNAEGAPPVASPVPSPLKAFLWLGLGLTLAVLGFYLTRTQNYNYGGHTAGLRWMFWLIPFWLIAMIPPLDAGADRRWFRWTAVGLLGISVFSAMYPLNNPWQHPWLFTLMEQWGWIDYRQDPPPFDRPVTTWFPELPDAEAPEPDWIEFAGPGFDGQRVRLRLSDAGRTETDGRLVQRIRARWNPGTERERSGTYPVDVEAFRAGRRPAEFVEWPGDRPSPEDRRHALTFLRGMPRFREYQPGFIRYLKTPLRREAFRCRRAASRVLHRPGDGDRAYWYRVDVWFCDDVPFGVLQVVTTVSEETSGNVVARRRLTAAAVSSIDSNPGEASPAPDPRRGREPR